MYGLVAEKECTALSDYLQIPAKEYLVERSGAAESRTRRGIMYFLTGYTEGGNSKIINEEHKEGHTGVEGEHICFGDNRSRCHSLMPSAP